MPSFAVYVHVPFCTALCPYCDFAVVVGRPDLHERYVDALIAEARARAALAPVEAAGSLFVGGGTPTMIDPGMLARVLDGIRSHVMVAADAEVTVEANPESATPDRLRTLAAAGVNRVSIGAQSFADHVLRTLGRTHDASSIPHAVEAARAAGIANVGLDLIYGAPGESLADWQASLDAAIGLGVDHVSCYALTIEERTAFGRAVARGRMAEPEQDALAERYEVAIDRLGAGGYRHYELSNWARPEAHSRHNLLYWTQGDYIGLGLGAHSHRAGRRWWNTRAVARYLSAPADAIEGEEVLDEGQRAEEWLHLRLRLVEGVDLDAASTRLGRDLGPALEPLERAGLIAREGRRLRLTSRGMLLENEVAVRLLQPLGA